MSDEKTKSGFFTSAMSSYGSLLRFSIFLLIIALFLALLGFFHEQAFPNSTITFNDEGVVSFEMSSNEDVYIYLHPANKVWNNTNIKVKKGDKLKIKVSGNYNSSIHHLVKYGQTDSVLLFDWTSALGFANEKQGLNRNIDTIRNKKENLIYEGANFGQLLMLVSKDEISENKNNYPNRVKKGSQEYKIQELKNESVIDYTAESDGYLYITVNEILLQKKDKAIYCPPFESDPKYYDGDRDIYDEKEKVWNEYIVKNNQYDIWFKDNIGYLLVYVKVEKSSFLKRLFK